MSEELNKFYNKFEIPLTYFRPEDVFNYITPDCKYSKYIKSVYTACHSEDGVGSGRPFGYKLSRKEYYKLLRKISLDKKVVITMPMYNIDIMEKYVDLGVSEFMVTCWDENIERFKSKYPDILVKRSIVGNARNLDLDTRFDEVVLPYQYMLNINKLHEWSNKTKITVLPNHFCYMTCKYLDSHPYESILNIDNFSICPESYIKNLFIPRQVLIKLLPYVNTIKLVERQNSSSYFENYLSYYVFNTKLKMSSPREMCNRQTIELYEKSNMPSLMCEFKCGNCDKPCY